MKIELKGAHIAVVGAFASYDSADDLCSTLRARGAADATRAIKTKTTLLVEGKAQKTYYPNKNVLAANARGVPVLDEEQVKALIADGELEFEEVGPLAVGREHVGELIGDARALLDGAATSETWSGIIRLVDACSAEQLDELVAYLEPQVSRWLTDQHDRWVPAEDDPIRNTADSNFFRYLRRGKLRVAPPSWTVRGTKEESPKLRLIESISARSLKLKTTDLLKLLGREELTGLTMLDLDESKVTKTFWKKAPLLPAFQQLEQLRLTRIKDDYIAMFEAAPELPNLFKLILDGWYDTDDAAHAALLASPMAAHLEILSLDSVGAVDQTAASLEGALPNLRELEVCCYELTAPLGQILKHPNLLERVEKITLVAADEYTTHRVAAYSDMDFGGLTELDLTGLNAESRLLGRDDWSANSRAQALEHYPGSALVKSIERLRLGDIWSPELADALDGQVELV